MGTSIAAAPSAPGESPGQEAGVQGPTTGAPAFADSGATPAGPPTWSSDFASRDDQWPYAPSQRPSDIAFGVPDPRADDDAVAELVLEGVPGLGPGDREGTAFATEIETSRTFQYGTYRARLTLPTCDASEDVVTGFFTYFNDGKDENGDGVVDNSEVDIEILCGSPHVIAMAIWTDASNQTGVVGVSVDLSTGNYWQTSVLPALTTGSSGNRPELLHPEFPDPNAFYEMGFDWQPSEVRFFIILGGTEITLWDYADAAHIPGLEPVLGFNMWHPSAHWTGDDSPANYPAHDAIMRIDWVRYWQP